MAESVQVIKFWSLHKQTKRGVSEFGFSRLARENIPRQAAPKLPKIQQFREGKRLRVLLLRVVMWLISAGEPKEHRRVRRLG